MVSIAPVGPGPAINTSHVFGSFMFAPQLIAIALY